MTITKYADVEAAEIPSPKEHQHIESELHRIGKTNARILDSQQREQVLARDPMRSSFKGIVNQRTAERLRAV